MLKVGIIQQANTANIAENIEKLKSCGVAFLDSPTEILPIALHYLGYKTDSQNPKELKEAEEQEAARAEEAEKEVKEEESRNTEASDNTESKN